MLGIQLLHFDIFDSLVSGCCVIPAWHRRQCLRRTVSNCLSHAETKTLFAHVHPRCTSGHSCSAFRKWQSAVCSYFCTLLKQKPVVLEHRPVAEAGSIDCEMVSEELVGILYPSLAEMDSSDYSRPNIHNNIQLRSKDTSHSTTPQKG